MCALCRRSVSPARETRQRRGPGVAVLAVAVVALFGAHAGIAMLLDGPKHDDIAPEPPPAAAPAALNEAQQRESESESERKAKQDALAKQIAALQSGETLEAETDAIEQAAAQQAAAQRTAAQQAAAERAAEQAAADQLERSKAPAPAEPDPKALERARKRVSIRMYTTTWCPACKSARDYMTTEGIRYSEFDVDKSPSARTIRDRLNPKGSIPTIDVEGEVMVGFSAQRLEHMIDDAARKHVRL